MITSYETLSTKSVCIFHNAQKHFGTLQKCNKYYHDYEHRQKSLVKFSIRVTQEINGLM